MNQLQLLLAQHKLLRADALRREAERLLGRQIGDDLLQRLAAEIGVPTASAVELPREFGCGPFAFRAVHRAVIPAAGPTLEKCAVLLLKLLRHLGGAKGRRKLCNLLLQFAFLLLQLRDLLFKFNVPVVGELEPLAQDRCRTVLVYEALDLAEKRDGHGSPPGSAELCRQGGGDK